VIVGANGAGKSNLISFFKLLRALIDETFTMLDWSTRSALQNRNCGCRESVV